ncbi:hypothetical protein RIF29_18972 [Crotalaria pallida]|uniref:Uncharacterized protein n=1 Tax=Crotalaria pallida TaxID=3830 RepID=A0AAN9F0F8_CROPI
MVDKGEKEDVMGVVESNAKVEYVTKKNKTRDEETIDKGEKEDGVGIADPNARAELKERFEIEIHDEIQGNLVEVELKKALKVLKEIQEELKSSKAYDVIAKLKPVIKENKTHDEERVDKDEKEDAMRVTDPNANTIVEESDFEGIIWNAVSLVTKKNKTYDEETVDKGEKDDVVGVADPNARVETHDEETVDKGEKEEVVGVADPLG